MICSDIMKRDVETVSPEETVRTAALRMRDRGIGFLPVCGAANEVLGTLTDRDLALRIVAEGLTALTPVADVMSDEVVACRPSDSLRAAEQLMALHHKSRIMCLDDLGRLAGIVSLSDIARFDSAVRAARTLRAVTERETE